MPLTLNNRSIRMSLKLLNADIFSLERIKDALERNQAVLVENCGQAGYASSMDYLCAAITALYEKKYALPIGYRFTGTFYVREPYADPTSSIEIQGSAYQREDLVSWIIEKGDNTTNQYYFRDIYRDNDRQTVIRREDAQPVYAKPQKNSQNDE